MRLASIILFAMVLTACGGGGDPAPVTGTPKPVLPIDREVPPCV